MRDGQTEFEQLYAAYAASVHRFALFLCGNVAQAEDITSETFIRVWTARSPLREETVKAYLFTIARNLYHQSGRRERRHVPLDADYVDRHPTAVDNYAQRDELAHVLADLQTLPEIDRAALVMRATDEVPYEEVASALGLSVAAAKVKVHRARRRLVQLKQHREEVK
ncbi:MAG: RNA polymerase sigma factor [Acidobacteriaceae bacterium]|nr:RNA polymerase sigma factor [Acidobacteriaceae bacterium]